MLCGANTILSTKKMYTRFRSASGAHIMNVPLEVPHEIMGARFFCLLTGTYEEEEEYTLSWVLRLAKEFKTALERSDLREQSHVPKLLASLRSTIGFLESIPDEQASRRKPIPEAASFEDLLQSIPDERVILYSYDRAPSINEILDAWREGSNGIDDWAIEELEKKCEKGRRALLSALKKEKNKARLLTALELLIVIFRDDQTRAEVERFVESSGDDEIRQVARAITAQSRRSPPHQQSESRRDNSQGLD